MKYKIRVENKIVEVSEEVYKVYYHMENREDYLERRDKQKGIIHYNAYDTDDMTGEDMLKSDENVLNCVVDREERQALKNALCQLKEKDKELIEELYFNNRTERELAQLWGVKQPAIHKKKIRILKELQEILKSSS